MTRPGSADVAEFLARPLVARVAVNGPSGPTVRPVWFLYERGAFWWLTGTSYSRLTEWLLEDPRVALVIDTCDVRTGEVLAVSVRGEASTHPLDRALAVRKLSKYLGADMARWPSAFTAALDDESSRLISLLPTRPPRLRDMSFPPVD